MFTHTKKEQSNMSKWKQVCESFFHTGGAIEFERGRCDCLRRSSLMKCISDKTTADDNVVLFSTHFLLLHLAHVPTSDYIELLDYTTFGGM